MGVFAHHEMWAPLGAERVAFAAVAGEQLPASDFLHKIRPDGEYNGYTHFHLPIREVARPAILAAFIARSNLLIRLPFR